MEKLQLIDPLPQYVERYFGKYLKILIDALKRKDERYIEPYFIRCSIEPNSLNDRLCRVEPLGLTSSIIKEVGNITDPAILDKRLTDAWAELRTLDQIHKEGFTNIKKHKAFVDFTAQCGEETRVFQVIRVNRTLAEEIAKDIASHRRDNSEEPYPFKNDFYGNLNQISSSETGLLRFTNPISAVFWDAIAEKNGDLGKWKQKDYRRCLVLVTIDPGFEDDFEQLLTCYLLREMIHDEGLGKRNFEELIWLPNIGTGIWFLISEQKQNTRCFASSSLVLPGDEEVKRRENLKRREVELNFDVEKEIPYWKNEWWKSCAS